MEEDSPAQEGLHTIVKDAFELMYEGDGRLVWSMDKGEQIKTMLAQLLLSTEELEWAVQSLLGVAQKFEELGHTQVANEMRATCATACDALERQGRAQGQGHGTAGEFARFQDKEARKQAPQEGEEAPEGTIQLGTLDFQKRA